MRQKQIVERANNVLPAGGFGNFDPGVVINQGKGSRIWDADGNEYIDYLIGSGPMILGHGHPEVLDAVKKQIDKGMTFFANNSKGIELAEEICRSVACAERVRFVTSGSEADMYAMRLARAYTGRDIIVKFEGGYHGMSAEAQMSLAPMELIAFPKAVPDSAGIPEAIRDRVMIAPFNDIEFVRSLLSKHASDIAAVIVEPMQRIIPPLPGYLAELRQQCTKHSVLLVFDEIVTGYRMNYGGAQAYYSVKPDLCTLGKIIGGGFALAAIAGSEDIMAHFDEKRIGRNSFLMQVGTLSGNPVAAVAGLKTMEILRREGAYDRLFENGETLQNIFSEQLSKAGFAHKIVGNETLFDVVFTDSEVRNYRDMLQADAKLNAVFNRLLRERGIFKSPGKTYLSLALTDVDIEQTADAVSNAAQGLGDAVR